MSKTPEEMAEEYRTWVLINEQPEVEKPGGHLSLAFLAGYKAAQEQFRSTTKEAGDKLTPTGWISVKDRLPSCGVLCAWISDTTQSYIERIEVDDMHPWYEGFDYWCELPEPPKEDK